MHYLQEVFQPGKCKCFDFNPFNSTTIASSLRVQVAKLLIHKYCHASKLKCGSVCNLCKSRFEDIRKHHRDTHIRVIEEDPDTVII